MALHPAARKETLQAISHAPRPVLTQKPLHMEYSLAEELIAIAEEAGILLAVNQQARWAPGAQSVARVNGPRRAGADI